MDLVPIIIIVVVRKMQKWTALVTDLKVKYPNICFMYSYQIMAVTLAFGCGTNAFGSGIFGLDCLDDFGFTF